MADIVVSTGNVLGLTQSTSSIVLSTNNFYGSVGDSINYHGNTITGASWLCHSDAKKMAALIEATRCIDLLPLKGCKTNTTQKLQFPRDGALEVPQEIIEATYEWAKEIIDGNTIGTDLRVIRRQVGTVSTDYTQSNITLKDRLGVSSNKVWALLSGYLLDPRQIKFCRIT